MKIGKDDYVLIDVESVNMDKSSKPSKTEEPIDSQSPKEIEETPEGIEKVELGGEKGGPGYERSSKIKKGETEKKYSSKRALGKGGSKSEASKKWEDALRNASSAMSTLSEKGRKLLRELKSSTPKVNWKKELSKFVDSAFNKWEEVLPNKRLLASGDILYGAELSASDTLKTLVLPVDTSGSISNNQISAFLAEVFSLTTKFDVDTVYIVYTSDTIDAIDVVPKGKKPDLGMIRSTGGNREGFFPPFRFIKDPRKYQGKANGKLPAKINPSAVIYFTDTFAEYPQKSDFGISKYANRVIWFICLNKNQSFNVPPFGRYIHVPIDSKGNFI